MNRNVSADMPTEKKHSNGNILTKTVEVLAKKKNIFYNDEYNYCDVCRIEEIGIVSGNVQQVAWCECEDNGLVFTFTPKIESMLTDAKPKKVDAKTS